ncbi:DUF1694 domain-containing protein [Streptococcus plurextorum]|uniref:DUF1694 domain-containing protein n=1 Tax=Streptococcus plurextorum TaxID=456876 RepID=UPI000406EF0F|nr:DUF1694 domain-containing protein [Streptococcus plurextorum]
MNTLEKTILSKASGEHRLDPDQQRRCLGTFEERMVLSAELSDLSPDSLSEIPSLFAVAKKEYQPLFLKISGRLPIHLQMSLMKLAEAEKIPATIVQENGDFESYALVLHTDHAIAEGRKELALLLPKKENSTIEKKSFWQKWFG